MGSQEERLDKELRKSQRDQRIHEQTLEQLRTEERYVNFLKQYNGKTVEMFMTHYAMHKVFWYRYGGNHAKRKKRKRKEARKQVLVPFKRIMQKKLFNLKCRWVAGEVDVDGIEHSAQFSDWEQNAALIKAVGPIRSEEFLCFMQWYEHEPDYLLEYENDHPSDDQALQFYHLYRSFGKKDAKSFISPWFHEYDRHFRTAALLELPTLRRDMEQDHLDDWMKEIHMPSLSAKQRKRFVYTDRATCIRMNEDPAFEKEWLEKNLRFMQEKDEPEPQYEDFSVKNRKIMDEVVAAIEDHDMQKRYRISQRWKEICDKCDWHRKGLSDFKDLEEHVAVLPNEDYLQGINEAYAYYQHQTLLVELENIFQEYEDCLRQGLPFNWGKSSAGSADHQQERQRILAARKKKNLPENFDFLMKKNLP